jgi:hypothetical protein
MSILAPQKGRELEDALYSHDIEDLITLIDGRESLIPFGLFTLSPVDGLATI